MEKWVIGLFIGGPRTRSRTDDSTAPALRVLEARGAEVIEPDASSGMVARAMLGEVEGWDVSLMVPPSSRMLMSWSKWCTEKRCGFLYKRLNGSRSGNLLSWSEILHTSA